MERKSSKKVASSVKEVTHISVIHLIHMAQTTVLAGWDH
jgi:hypothetical protein